jgi:hypothetical protein
MPADTLQIDFVRHIRHRSRDDMTEHQRADSTALYYPTAWCCRPESLKRSRLALTHASVMP